VSNSLSRGRGRSATITAIAKTVVTAKITNHVMTVVVIVTTKKNPAKKNQISTLTQIQITEFII
jgi:hypothetical protein